MTGKWDQADVPHSGWTCVEIEDLGAPAAICEMCEYQEIRFVHTMEHPDFPDTLDCGCICAGHMEMDPDRAKKREATMKAAARRRATWLHRKGWRRSRAGNPMIRVNGYQVVIFPKDGGWGGLVEHPATERKMFARRTYPHMDAARLAAFDAIVFLENHP
jgi:hypothetical protein